MRRAQRTNLIDDARKSRDDAPAETLTWWEDFYRVVRRIPKGRVCTYGMVAALAGRPRSARHVGFALAALKVARNQSRVPWHRVLGARSRGRAAVSIKDPVGGALQRKLLEAEGVHFDAHAGVKLDKHGWAGKPDRFPAIPQRRDPAGKKGAPGVKKAPRVR